MTRAPLRVVITGSTRGTGFAIAEVFHARGARLVSLNRSLRGDAWLGEIRCDLSVASAVADAAARALRELQGVDVLILNAAVRRFAPVSDISDHAWDESVATNLTAPLRLIRALLPALRASKGSAIVLGSQAGSEFFEGGVAYCATKAALKPLVEVVNLEAGRDGVRASLVTPGAIANRDEDQSPHKLDPKRVAEIVYVLATLPADCLVREIDVRPAAPLPSPHTGVERLQFA
jgi:3-oxoacyl-[acyl-carrier protein] reductase